MYITVSQLAKKINHLERFTMGEFKQEKHERHTLNHYKVCFEIYGKKDPFIWFCFAENREQAMKQASDFLKEELQKGFYKSGMILSVKKM